MGSYWGGRKNRFAAAALALALFGLPTALWPGERRGADIVITLKAGKTVSGELIAVKPNSLLVFDPVGFDRSVDLGAIKTIRIVRKSKALPGALCGFVVGAVGGAVWGHSRGADADTQDLAAYLTGFALGAAGALIGGLVGDAVSEDKTIQFEAQSEAGRGKTLSDLRGRARIRDFK